MLLYIKKHLIYFYQKKNLFQNQFHLWSIFVKCVSVGVQVEK